MSPDSEQIRWEQPPDSRTPNRRYDQFKAALRSRRGEWAIAGDYDSPNNATNFTKTWGPEFEITRRRLDSGKYRVYARFIGSKS